jgi:glutamate-1-semialdehyde 2,1-aminomutase
MEKVSPVGPVYQAGTLSGNPLAVAGGLATLEVLAEHPQIYGDLDRRAERLAGGVLAAAQEAGEPLCVNRVGSMLTFFFQEGPVVDWDTASKSDTGRFARFFRGMLERGVYLPCSQYEAAFLSAALTDEDIEATISVASAALGDLKD